MREIKFRGNLIDGGYWIYGYYYVESPPLQPFKVPENRDSAKHYIIFAGFADWNMPRMQQGEVDPNTVGQYTGFKDRLNQEIYEGDVVESTWGKWDDLVKFQIIFTEGCFMYSPFKEELPDGQKVWKCLMTHDKNEDLEIIGNVYEISSNDLVDDSRMKNPPKKPANSGE